MKKRWTLVTGIVLALVLVGGMVLSCAAPAPEVPAEVGALQKALAAKEAELARLQSSSKADLAKLESEIAALEKEIVELKKPPAPVKTVTVKFAMYQPSTHGWVKAVTHMPDVWEKATNGVVKLEIYDSQTLIKAKGANLYTGVQEGIADITWASGGMASGAVPLFGFPYIPIWRDVRGVNDAFENGIEEIFVSELRALGMDDIDVAGGVSYNGFIGSMYPIRVPADLEGLKVGAYMGQIVKDFQAAGISCGSVHVSEMYEALTRGMYDVTTGVCTNWVDWKFAEPINYILYWPMYSCRMQLVYNKSALDKIPEVYRGTVRELIDRLALRLKHSTYDLVLYQEATMMPRMAEMYTPTAEEAAEWQEFFTPAIGELIEDLGPNAVKAYDIALKWNE
ncbi:hypothetical protein ES703_49795 [subsurface metagenome]